jgi:hypothetical protein
MTERELQALIRRTQKKVRKQRQEPAEQADDETQDSGKKRRVRYVDTSGERDMRVADASAEEIFQEMKRRSF